MSDYKGKISGTHWNITTVSMRDDDSRRHKSRCMYHDKDNYCHFRRMKCFGSAQCPNYRELKAGEKAPEPYVKKGSSLMPGQKSVSAVKVVEANNTTQRSAENKIILDRVRKRVAEQNNRETTTKVVKDDNNKQELRKRKKITFQSGGFLLLGKEMIHNEYGKGIIKEISGNRIRVCFSESVVKSFDIKDADFLKKSYLVDGDV